MTHFGLANVGGVVCNGDMFKSSPTPASGAAAPVVAGAEGAAAPSLPPAEVYAATVGPAISELVKVRAQITALQAREATLLQQCDEAASRLARDEGHLDHGEFAHRSVAAEIGFALRESDRSMVHQIARASTLVEHYPAVHAALAAGEISQGHVSVIRDAGGILGIGDAEVDRKRAIYEQQVLEIAKTETAGRLRAIAKGLAEALACRPLQDRHAEALRGRGVVLVEQPDGMVDLVATVSAIYGKGIMDRLDQIGWAVKNANRNAAAADPGGEVDERSLNEIRADAFVEMLLSADPSGIASAHGKGLAAIKARVQVIIPEEKLRDRSAAGSARRDSASGSIGDKASDHIATELVGYGPIDTDTSRTVAGLSPAWERIMVSTLTGQVLSTDTYRPSAAIKRFLAARDLRCRAPGCNVMVNRSDIDHTLDAALGGTTSTDNLATTCRYHHTMKHHPGWKIRQHPGGVMEWETPLGRKYTDRPGSTVRFRRVVHAESADPF
ncbi:DUF222 domain-containing protein [Leucobacter insecticola]|uniref:DUF222 domain-containing protein n=1 Tax=Leucobacter insecticola TaxID=2714934 RepID=A0A6G8FJG7_9MICO|nr:HNH endonuclease signature motif containing protein [Leucobacter insecticola]QIM16443.1 DUF222 domain-containing protein [Leucobacter insecticola]